MRDGEIARYGAAVGRRAGMGWGEAEDEGAQEARIALWRAAGRYDAARGGREGYECVVIANAVRDLARRGRARRYDPLGLAMRGGQDVAHVADRRAEDPAEVARYDDLRGVVCEEIAALGEPVASAMRAILLEGETYEEAGARLGVPTGTVASRVSRGLRALRLALARRGVTGE